MAKASMRVFDEAMESGRGELDFSAIADIFLKI